VVGLTVVGLTVVGLTVVGLTVSWFRTDRTHVSRHPGLGVSRHRGSRRGAQTPADGCAGCRRPAWSCAVILEKRSVAEVVATYGVSRSWVYELLLRYRDEGEAALEPRSKAPKTSPGATPTDTVDLIVAIRTRLGKAGHDAGADTVRWHLEHTQGITVSRATVHRILTRHGLIGPEQKERPKTSYIRFEAAMPNETWQSDFTHYPTRSVS
jgi:transposase